MQRTIHIFGGTHGNERLGAHLVQSLKQKDFSFQTSFNIIPILANPKATQRNSRYIDTDLNRSFTPKSYTDTESTDYEVKQAQYLYQKMKNTYFLIDLHSTTSNMGVSIIISEWTPPMLQICQLILELIPQSYILYESILEGGSENLALHTMTLEVGPIGQGVIRPYQFDAYKKNIQNILFAIEKVEKDYQKTPTKYSITPPPTPFIYYARTTFKVDYPRDKDGFPSVIIHPFFEKRNYKPLSLEQKIFITHQGHTLMLQDLNLDPDLVENIKNQRNMCAIFIGEASYIEKGIAFIIAECMTHK